MTASGGSGPGDRGEADVRRGQGPGHLGRDAFAERFRARFDDPAFASEAEAIARLEAIAWDAYQAGRKAPRTTPAGAEFADPSYSLSVEWLATRQRIRAAERRHADPESPSRVLLIIGSPRNDDTCPSEASKSWRLAGVVRAEIEAAIHFTADVLDLSLLTSEYGRRIYPCKGCVSTAMPLCHWPCSCYPNHALDQTGDIMAEVYERFALAHAVIIVTPVHWYQAPSVLKLLMDRMVCADGGNADPTKTRGKDPELAKSLELEGWDYPKHLAGRAFGVITHGDAAGARDLRRAISDWLADMGLVSAGEFAELDRFIGYYEPYATSHAALDRDAALIEEARNVARAVCTAAFDLRKKRREEPGRALKQPRPK